MTETPETPPEQPRWIAYTALEDLVPALVNAKRHHGDGIAASIARFGYVEAITLDERTGRMVAGHGRLEQLLAARDRGDELPDGVIRDDAGRWLVGVQRGWASANDAEAEAYLLASNKLPELGGWDDTDYEASLERIRQHDATLLAAIGEPIPRRVPVDAHQRDLTDEPPERPKAPITQPGDLWTLGDHLLICGDSFDAAVLDELLGNAEVDAVLTDPPYAIYGSATGINSDIADDKMVRPFFEAIGRNIAGRLAYFGHAYVHTDWRSWAALWEGFKRSGLTPKNCLVWDKGGFGLGANWPNAHEFVAFFTRIPPHGAMTSSRPLGQRQVLTHVNILRHPRVRGEEREHNAAKPVAMLAEILEHSTDPTQLVLDLFAGSGSTLIACERTDRRCRAVEMEPAWCDVICARWQRETGHQPTRAGKPHDFTPA